MTLYEIDKSIEALVNAVDPDTGEITVDNDALGRSADGARRKG